MSSIECPICLEDKDEYKTLICGHELCNECEIKLNENNILNKCPICRTPLNWVGLISNVNAGTINESNIIRSAITSNIIDEETGAALEQVNHDNDNNIAQTLYNTIINITREHENYYDSDNDINNHNQDDRSLNSIVPAPRRNLQRERARRRAVVYNDNGGTRINNNDNEFYGNIACGCFTLVFIFIVFLTNMN